MTLSASIGEGVNILVTKGTFFAVAYCASLAAWGSDPVKNISAGLVGLIIGFFVETTLFVLRSSSTIRAAFSPIMIEGALVLPDVSVGMIEASATRRPEMPWTRRRSSTTAIGSLPILQVPTG